MFSGCPQSINPVSRRTPTPALSVSPSPSGIATESTTDEPDEKEGRTGPAREMYDRAHDVFKQDKEYEKALGMFEKIVKDHPGSPWGYIGLSKVYCRLQRYDKAEDYAKQALEIEPGSYEALFCLENLYNDTRVARYRDAEKVILKILESHPDDFDALFSLAETYQVLGDHKKHLEYFEKAMKADISREQYKNLGSITAVLISHGKAKEAGELLEREIKKHPDSFELYATYGDYYNKLEQYGLAEKMLKKSLELNPDYQRTYIKLSELYHDREEYQKALDCLEEGLKHHPGDEDEDLEIYGNMAMIYVNMGKFDRAEKTVDKLLTYGQKAYGIDMADTYAEAGGWYFKMGRMKKAEAAYKNALKLTPGNSMATLGMARILIKAGKKKEAEAYVEKAEKNIPESMEELREELEEVKKKM